MSWEQQPLLAKAKLFFEKAFAEEKNDAAFALWCAMGLELLARAALARFSPTLLAEPDKDHRFLLQALNLGTANASRKSISTIQVLALCKSLIPQFTEENMKHAIALSNRRNEELHSGTAAFAQYPTQEWLPGFYNCCEVLGQSQSQTLDDLFGSEEGAAATAILNALKEKVLESVKGTIAAHKRVFEAKTEESRRGLAANAEEKSNLLAYQKHHRVRCPACGSVATVQGEPYGPEQVEHNDSEINVRRSVIPNQFQCLACELKLSGYAQLSAAGVADHFTQRTSFSPEEFYNLVNPEDIDRSYGDDEGYHFSNE